jgi:hypothetical protein
MPKDLAAKIVRPWNVMHYNEVPRTKCLDWFEAIKVDLVTGPRETVYTMMAEMQQASYSPDLETAIARARAAIEDGTYGNQPLPLNQEVAVFGFRISGISRAMTHQIVRTRIGVTFAQKCTGDGDVRHDDLLVPRGFSDDEVEWYISLALNFKHWYAAVIDKGRSVHSSRYAMPHGLSQYIYMNISFLALREMYGKRSCTEQPPEWQVICAGFKKALEPEYPAFARLLVSNCERKACFFHKFGNNDPRIGRLYFPDEAHDVEPWHPESFLHKGTAAEIMGGAPFVPRLYEGYRRIY